MRWRGGGRAVPSPRRSSRTTRRSRCSKPCRCAKTRSIPGGSPSPGSTGASRSSGGKFRAAAGRRWNASVKPWPSSRLPRFPRMTVSGPLRAGAWGNLAGALMELGEEQPGIRSAAHQALALVKPSEGSDRVALEVGLKARHLLCRLAVRDIAEEKPLSRATLAEATDAVEEALALVRSWKLPEDAALARLARGIFRFGCRIYESAQPHFLAEFLMEYLSPEEFGAACSTTRRRARSRRPSGAFSTSCRWRASGSSPPPSSSRSSPTSGNCGRSRSGSAACARVEAGLFFPRNRTPTFRKRPLAEISRSWQNKQHGTPRRRNFPEEEPTPFHPRLANVIVMAGMAKGQSLPAPDGSATRPPRRARLIPARRRPPRLRTQIRPPLPPPR